MSLLSDEQIEDLWETMCEAGDWKQQQLLQISGHVTMCEAGDWKLAKIALKKWNKKQTDTNEPNWDEIAKEIKGVQHRYYYFDDRGEQINWHVVKQYIRPIPCHPHAEIMMKYAEVAARRVDPWAEFEFRGGEGDPWERPAVNVSFYADWEYRYVGEQQ